MQWMTGEDGEPVKGGTFMYWCGPEKE
jgi:hypothetical protein